MEEDERRESALAKSASLQPNSTPAGVSESQLKKFQELHKRRLQIKSKFKSKKKPKDNKKFGGNDLKEKDCIKEGSDLAPEGSSVGGSSDTMEHSPLDDVPLAFKKRKLHWGLDTKERWERKSNM